MSCECEPLRWARALHPGGTDQYAVDFEADLTRWLERRTWYAAGVRVRSRLVGGYEWEITVAGQTGLVEKRLPTTLGQTVVDGSATLTCRAISTDSLEATLDGATWESSGVTISSEILSAQRAIATLTSDDEGEHEVLVTGTAGVRTIPVTCILKVARCQE
jgi:hypothetical protein